MQTTSSRSAGAKHGRCRHLEHGSYRSRSLPRPVVKPPAPESPRIVTVFRGADGQMHHGRCGRTLEYMGRRAHLELDFYCPLCFEHVSVPECTLPRILVAVPAGQPGRVAPLAIKADRPRRIDRAVDYFGARRAAA